MAIEIVNNYVRNHRYYDFDKAKHLLYSIFFMKNQFVQQKETICTIFSVSPERCLTFCPGMVGL